MEEWLESHPLISLSSIEKALGITHGILRKGSIPEKYLEAIAGLLASYGYGEPVVMQEVVKQPIKTILEPADTKNRCILKKVKVGISDYAFLVGNMNEQGNFVRKNDIQDGASVVI